MTIQQTIACCILAFAAAFPRNGCAASPAKMNVVFILADDLGWSDTTLYGNTSLYQTPNLERLAKRGMVFTHAYANSPLCSPTRASILTGQTPARHGSTAPQHHEKTVRLKPTLRTSASPGDKALETQSATRLDTNLPTLGKQIHAAGYATAHFGKWHLGAEPYSPLQHGFEVDIPHWPGPGPAGSYLAPWRFSASPQSKGFKANFPGEHIEDRMASEAEKWLETVAGKRPFYMNYWQFSVHAPFDAKPELVEYYRKRIDPNDPQRSPTYAAMVRSMDDAVGTLLDAIDAAGIADRTAIVFISDNGGNMYDQVDGTTPTSNFPLRGGKATMFEGGTRVPCVVVWPGVARPGSRSDAVIQTSDFYPTILNLLGIPLPENHIIDGIDITPALRGGMLDRQAIFTYFPHAPPIPDWLPPSMSVVSGDWKLIRLFCQGENGAHDYRLYNLADDIGEQTNLAADYPERVQAMDRMIEEYIQEAGTVVPQPNPRFDPRRYLPENIGVPRAEWKVAGLVAGWVPDGTCTIRKEAGALVVESDGGDPYLSVHEMKKCAGGPFVLRVRMRSNASGNPAVYWNSPARERMASFPAKADGRWHEYQVGIPVEELAGLRLDPAQGAGRIDIGWIRLENTSGEIVREWTF